MKQILSAFAVAFAVLFAFSGGPADGAEPTESSVSSENAVSLPAECRTKTRLARILPNALPRAWVFIYNFEVADTGCLLVYDRADSNKIQGYEPIACNTVGMVDVISGTGKFTGEGYVRCDVNLMQRVNALSGTVQLTETALIDGFYMLGRGILSPTVAPTPTLTNLIVSYVPTDTTREPVSLRVFVTETGSTPKAQIGTRFNGNDHTHPDCWAPVLPVMQKWAVTRTGFNLRFWYNTRERCIKNFPKIDLAQNGGAFFIGGRPGPVGFYLRALLDEVIVDPFDGVGPPGLEETFLPMMLLE